jgi:hypothetical protein
MTVRIVSPASGAVSLSFAYGESTEILTAGELIDVPPGSALEDAIGTGNLTVPTAKQLSDAANGGAGAVSN